jgi:hypothetical protein
MAAHSDPKTTRPYHRRSNQVSRDEVERIGFEAQRRLRVRAVGKEKPVPEVANLAADGCQFLVIVSD